jgi:hypothetical protein
LAQAQVADVSFLQRSAGTRKEDTVPRSILEAIQQGLWDYEPQPEAQPNYASTDALPGTRKKLDVLAERLQSGLPLWHPHDRHTASEGDDLRC